MDILRSALILAMETGREFTTIANLDRRAYAPLARAQLVDVDGRTYVRSDAEACPADHLPGVAEF